MSENKQLRYYDEADIKKIANSCRLIGGEDVKLTISEMGDYLEEAYIAGSLPSGEYVQPDWNQEVSSAKDYIKNKPPIENGTGEKSVVIGDGKAIGKYAVAGGFNTIAGSKAFTILGVDTKNKTYTLDSVEGLEVGDIYSVHVYYSDGSSSQGENKGSITSISGNMVTVDNIFCEKTFATLDSYLDEYGVDTERNSFRIINKPLVGTRYLGYGASTEGDKNQSLLKGAHTDGSENIAYGSYSHAEGRRTKAGYCGHSEGANTQAIGFWSHAENNSSKAIGASSHAGGSSTAHGDYSFAHGRINNAHSPYSTVFGYNNTVNGNSTFAAGENNNVNGKQSSVFGYNNTIKGESAFSSGKNNNINGNQSVAFGDGNTINSYNSFITGWENETAHPGVFITGRGNIANGNYNVVTGYNNKNYGHCAYIEGNSNINGDESNPNNTAVGRISHIEGASNKIIGGNHVHIEGLGNVGTNECQHVQGQYNSYENLSSDVIHVVGNGTSNTNRSNAHTLDKKGNAWYAGDITSENRLITKKGLEAGSNVVSVTDNSVAIGKDAIAGYVNSRKDTYYGYEILGSSRINISGIIGFDGYYLDDGSGYMITDDELIIFDKTGNIIDFYKPGDGLKIDSDGNLTGYGEGFDFELPIGSYLSSKSIVLDSNYAQDVEVTFTSISNTNAYAEGQGVKAFGQNQHVQGKYNVEDTESKYAHIVGNGSSDSERSNAHTVDWKGNAWYAGDVYVGGTSQDDGTRLAKITEVLTRAVSDLENYYLKSETYTQEEINNLISVIPKFDIEVAPSLPTENISETTVYLLPSDSKQGNLYSEHIYVNGQWETLGSQTIDLPPIEKSGGENSLQQTLNREAFTVANGEINESSDVERDESGNIKSGAFGAYSAIFGGSAQAKGKRSMASGSNTVALGGYSHAEGNETFAGGTNSHAEGLLTSALGINSHSEGDSTITEGEASHVEGYQSIARGKASHAEGHTTQANGNYSHAEGVGTQVDGDAGHAEGLETQANGNYSHAEGRKSIASGAFSHSEGHVTVASGAYSHSEGNSREASGMASHAEGSGTQANGNYSHAEGNGAISLGDASHSEGAGTKANGHYSHAEGVGTEAEGVDSHAEGSGTQSIGDHSHAEGFQTVALGVVQHVQGKHNIEDNENKYAHIIGNGVCETDKYGAAYKLIPSNAHTVDWQGNAWYKGSVTSNGADYAEYFEWLDGNPNNEDRIGYIVSLEGGKIKFANENSKVLGIISGTAAVLGDNYECEWNRKYLTDDFGRIQYEDVEEFTDVVVGIDEETNEPIIEKKSLGFFKHPILNPDYDSTQTYVNRANRPEWDTVGMFGKLYVRDDGTCQVDEYAKVGANGIATVSMEETNIIVLSRVNDNVIRVLLK